MTLKVDKQGRVTCLEATPEATKPVLHKSPAAIELFGKGLLVTILVLVGIVLLAICPPISPVAALLFFLIMNERK